MHYDLLTIYLTSAHDTYAKPKCVQICYSINRHDMYYTPTTDKQEYVISAERFSVKSNYNQTSSKYQLLIHNIIFVF